MGECQKARPPTIIRSIMNNIIHQIKNWFISLLLFVLVTAAGYEGYKWYVYFQKKAETRAWRRAQNENTMSAYVAFLEQYPDGKHEDVALSCLTELKEKEKRWKEVQASSDPMCIRKYMEDYPTDIRLPKLKKNLDQVLWNRAKVSDNVDGYAEYLLLMPDGLHAREAEQKVEILEKAVLTAGEGEKCVSTIVSFFTAMNEKDETNLLRTVAPYLTFQRRKASRNEILSYMNSFYAEDVYSLRWAVIDYSISKEINKEGKTKLSMKFTVDIHIKRADSELTKYSNYDGFAAFNERGKIVEMNLTRLASY